uniref:Uncharacterized protein n=1 Tax=Pyxicephalus adspersus TaxID=30357 RepID=A0AAV3B5N2_PYXAD|nr:TPA: hypothetical protein GDO54_000638 [Pyxicephalus adspersus]
MFSESRRMHLQAFKHFHTVSISCGCWSLSSLMSTVGFPRYVLGQSLCICVEGFVLPSSSRISIWHCLYFYELCTFLGVLVCTVYTLLL